MPEDVKTRLFPKSFLWGASTSAHQVEGGNHNNWTVWELEVAADQAKRAKKRFGDLEIWPEIKNQAQDPNNYVSGDGVEHYKRYEQDFDLLKGLNLNAFRFGIEWSRIEPEEGQWNSEEIEHYRRYIQALKDRGIEPVLNIWHWSMPVWFARRGGFKKYSNIRYFDRFVAKIGLEYGEMLRYVITLNEPNVYTSFSYQFGLWPPQEKSVLSMLQVYWNLVLTHRRAYKILKRANPKLQVGIADQVANIQAKRPHNFFDELSTKVMRYGWNWWFLRRIRRQQDFVGINYYFTDYYNGLFKRENPKVLLSSAHTHSFL